VSALAEHVGAVAREAAARAAQWEVLAIERTDTAVDLGSGVADTLRSSAETTLCLRVYRDGRAGTATTTRPADASAVVQDALATAQHGPSAVAPPPMPAAALPRRPLGGSRGTAPRDDRAACVAGVGQLAAGLGLLQRETGLSVHGSVSHTWQAVHRAAPDGTSVDCQEFYHLSAVAEGRNSPHLQLPWTGWSRGSGLPAGLRDWLHLAAPWDRLPADLPASARADLLLAPAALHALLTPLVIALSGTAAAAGRSFLPGRLEGDQLLHPSLSLVDEPPPPDADDTGTSGLAWPGTDDEGVACARLTLIEQGVPAHRYHSRHTAAAAGESPTGHGFRGNALRRTMLRPVTPVLNGATLRAGPQRTVPLADLVAGISNGILVESLLGGQQRSGLSPVVEGRIRLGFAIRDGRIIGTVRPEPLGLDLRAVLGARFVAATAEQWGVSRIWSARLPFVLAAAAAPNGERSGSG
jgi:PmbA protein